MQAANFRDDAERAFVVAAFRNLQVRGEKVAGLDARRLVHRGQQMRCTGVRNRSHLRRFGAPQQFRQVEKIAGADENIDLRQFLAQFGAVALRKASGDHQPPTDAALFDLRCLQDGADGFLLGRLDKRARVHNQHLGVARVERDVEPRAHQGTEHQLAVSEVFGATQSQKMNLFHVEYGNIRYLREYRCTRRTSEMQSMFQKLSEKSVTAGTNRANSSYIRWRNDIGTVRGPEFEP
jgi:hypothetical protein